MSTNKDVFKIGNFGFFKDADLTMRLSEDNLYDQIGSDGTVEVWFGGEDVWIPDFGVFNIYATCRQSFFWDIVDENGKRTKTGFTEMQIPYNPRFEPVEGDLIPINSEEVFDYTFESPSVGDNQLICSNLWFYTNMFLDEYYRYNLLLLNVANGSNSLDETTVRNTPMNDKLSIHDGEFIYGYRPKPEYMNQLAILKTLISGPENKILFRLKVDLEFLSENPSAKRSIRIFSQTDDIIQYTLYPKSTDDIIWRNNSRNFLNEYERYLLDYGVMQYMPYESELDWADKEYSRYMETSNKILGIGESYLRDIAKDMTNILENGEAGMELAGYSAIIKDDFIAWVKENKDETIVTEKYKILKRVLLTRKYFKGFNRLGLKMGIGIDVPGVEEEPGLVKEPQQETVRIVKKDGVRGFENGYIPSSANGYLHPKDGYLYEGDTGTGFYKILIAKQECHVFCDMETDGGGWMIIIAGMNTSVNYLSMFGDTYFIKDKIYRDESYGIGWEPDGTDELAFQMYNVPFSEVKTVISGDHNNPSGSTGALTFYSSSKGEIIRIRDNGTQSVMVDGVIELDNKDDVVENFIANSEGGTGEMNSLTIKTKRIESGYFSRRFISDLRIR